MRMLGKLKIYGVIGIAFLLVIGLGYWYYKDTQARLEQLAADRARLETAVKIQQDTIQSMTDFYANQAENLTQLQKDLASAEAEKDKLADKLSRHDLTTLARRKPTLIENRMNAATRKVIEELRGSR
jgi:septal ring factor EnvC (AmiA/AmiB activator)